MNHIQDKATDNKPRKRGPSGRNAFQEEQRQRTREAVIAAAREVFARTPYVYASIDDILRLAGIGRTTFYMHFSCKLDLVRAILEEITPTWQAVFAHLATLDPAEPGALERWMEQLVEVYRQHGAVSALLLHASALEDEFHQHLLDVQDKLIDTLGQHQAAFREAGKHTHAGRKAHVQARLLLTRLDQVCYQLAMRGVPPGEHALYIALVSDDLRRFLMG